MAKYFILVIGALFLTSCSNGSGANPIVTIPIFTWVKGENAVNPSGVYGIRGVPAAENTPGGRTGATNWTDINGNLWLFGGTSSQSNNTVLNDLWKYNITTNSWTWVKGKSLTNQPGVLKTISLHLAIRWIRFWYI